MEKKTRVLIFLAAGVVVVISCLLIVAALISYRNVENLSRHMKEQLRAADTMQEESLPPEEYPGLPEAAEGAAVTPATGGLAQLSAALPAISGPGTAGMLG